MENKNRKEKRINRVSPVLGPKTPAGPFAFSAPTKSTTHLVLSLDADLRLTTRAHKLNANTLAQPRAVKLPVGPHRQSRLCLLPHPARACGQLVDPGCQTLLLNQTGLRALEQKGATNRARILASSSLSGRLRVLIPGPKIAQHRPSTLESRR